MSKINALRLINLNYNNNAIRVNDETFHFNGESTLMSLRNGGGKSVLVQMMTAPFVHKRYRDAKDRPFESYFTTGKPSFILVEWVLDRGAGYVMTGMMIRRSQDSENTSGENLEIINLISEYREPCFQDISHLPVVEKGKRGMILKNFSACRNLFESYKKDSSLNFFCYDMTNGAQSRQYFEKLKEYQINYKEWENIIKKVNLKESGLSDLFADCRDEKGLVEKWFLEAVEGKLNKDKNRMKEFQVILEKYVGQYKDNRSKIKRRDTIRQFKQEAVQVREKAEICEAAEQKKQQQESRIACFMAELNRLRDLTEEEKNELSGKIDEIRQQAAWIEYEKLSFEIHELKRQQEYAFSNQEMISAERDVLERQADKINHQLHLLICAGQQGKVNEAADELGLIRQRIQVSKKHEQELEPERIRLGSALKACYAELISVNQKKQTENQTLMEQLSDKMTQEKENIRTLEDQIRAATLREGALKSSVKSYDQQEIRYNSRYGEDFSRNVLGEYEPGFLDICKSEYDRGLEQLRHDRTRKRQQLEKAGEKEKRLERDISDLRVLSIRLEEEEKQQKLQLERYDKELEFRRICLKYLNLDETNLFHLEKILDASERKLQEIAALKRNLEREEDELQKEYQKLIKGTWLELPVKLENELKNMGIPLVYGMEWLQKNGYAPEKNREILKRLPFLPYALILSAADLEKLSVHAGSVFTSFPIPVVLREHLDKKDMAAKSGPVIGLDGVSFYLFFNHELLDQERLNRMAEEKQDQIRRKQEAVLVRQKEYEEYFDRQQTIRNQETDQKKYHGVQEKLKQLADRLEQGNQEIQRLSGEVSQIKTEKQQLEAEIRQSDKEMDRKIQQLEDFELLRGAYEIYEEERRDLDKCRKEKKGYEEFQEISRASLEQLQEQKVTCDNKQSEFLREMDQFKEKGQKYERYEQNADILSELLKTYESVSVLENQYLAITSLMSKEIQDLEQQEQRSLKRFSQACEELEYLRKKYRLKSGDWKDILYNRREEQHQEAMLEGCNLKLEIKKSQWNEEDKRLAVLAGQIEDRMSRMKLECGKDQPLSRSQIQDRDFDARKKQLRYREQELEKQNESMETRLQGYEENLTALSEYSEFKAPEEMIFEEDFADMDRKQLRNFKGILVRDYNQFIRDRRDAGDRLAYVLNQMIRQNVFQEEYYRKPLESMLALSGNAGQVLRQLDTTIQSYDGLMEKLEVDISLVEKEKNRIVELLEDYIREVHSNLGKIDQNSTINVRGRSIKMLKIQLPAWNENENLYHIRLVDLIDEMTRKGIEIFERNENAQEYFGTRMTTRNLYDTVIGISNIQIRLYKIEAQREYPITWTEVTRNSGGEGFLSAFVILSSLLCYMRKDETDIFSDHNEGKVLVMDNPFAQTNASHLLIPLMDMAKKTNTQLICLTGLGGESIYNRFDNIYVMNLVSASLKNGMQYLKAEHLRGNEPEEMVVSQIEVVEQMRLF